MSTFVLLTLPAVCHVGTYAAPEVSPDAIDWEQVGTILVELSVAIKQQMELIGQIVNETDPAIGQNVEEQFQSGRQPIIRTLVDLLDSARNEDLTDEVAEVQLDHLNIVNKTMALVSPELVKLPPDVNMDIFRIYVALRSQIVIKSREV